VGEAKRVRASTSRMVMQDMLKVAWPEKRPQLRKMTTMP
jgi:hypothetical protein